MRDEVAKLRAADHQYQEAEIGLQEAMTHAIGSGCVVSDYYTQTEWALLSRAAESQETAQQQIAVRQSYLGESTPAGAQVARAQAGDTFRNAAIEGHAKLVRMAAMAENPAGGFGCGQGIAPDAQLATDMAKTLGGNPQTGEGRTPRAGTSSVSTSAFTPYRPYYLPETGLDAGLWNEAMNNAEYARNSRRTKWRTHASSTRRRRTCATRLSRSRTRWTWRSQTSTAAAIPGPQMTRRSSSAQWTRGKALDACYAFVGDASKARLRAVHGPQG